MTSTASPELTIRLKGLLQSHDLAWLDDQLFTVERIAARWSRTAGTVHMMRTRLEMPDPDLFVGRTPVWLESTLLAMERENPGIDLKVKAERREEEERQREEAKEQRRLAKEAKAKGEQ